MTIDRDSAAAHLAGLWRSGRQVAALPEELRPSSLTEGYDIQDRLVAALGERVVGWKLGVGSRKARVETQIADPSRAAFSPPVASGPAKR
jgi:2-keto-4-pentenoate hydratase